MLNINKLKINSVEGNKSLVTEASLEVAEGQIVLLEGVNGSGKSTILNAIMHNPNYVIESGKVFVGDTDVTDYSTDKLARLGVYISMQHSPEIEGVSTIKMLYKAYKFVNQKDGDTETQKGLSITEFKNELEAKCKTFELDTSLLMRDVNVGFSGGQKKQADLMHMLALEPKVILMDEPDSGVDREAVTKVYAVINYFKNKGAAILLTSHNEKIKDLHINKTYKIENKIVNFL